MWTYPLCTLPWISLSMCSSSQLSKHQDDTIRAAHRAITVDGRTVPFRSIRQALLHVTHLPKFWFRHFGQATVTLHEKFGRWPPEARNFGVYGVGPAKVFGTSPKWPLPPLHFGELRGPVTRYCRIDRNGTVVCTGLVFRRRSPLGEPGMKVHKLKGF